MPPCVSVISHYKPFVQICVKENSEYNNHREISCNNATMKVQCKTLKDSKGTSCISAHHTLFHTRDTLFKNYISASVESILPVNHTRVNATLLLLSNSQILQQLYTKSTHCTFHPITFISQSSGLQTIGPSQKPGWRYTPSLDMLMSFIGMDRMKNEEPRINNTI